MLEINPNCGVYYPPKDYGSATFACRWIPRATQDSRGSLWPRRLAATVA